MTPVEAYQVCERITRSQARNFSYGIRLLPPVKRAALSAVYAFARRIDDIGDEPGTPAEKLARLELARADLAAIGTAGSDAVLVALADAADRLPIPLAAFEELIDGVEMDVRGTRYGTIDELVHYCRCVAGSIGRLSLGVFGSRDGALAVSLADSLGVALQLTNILRDVREDLRAGRVYLPEQDRARHGARLALLPDGRLAPPHEPVVRLIRFEAARAHTWYVEGLRLLPLLDRRSAACCAAMAGIYHRLLERIVQRPEESLRQRMSLPPTQKAAVAARALVGAGR